MFCWLTYQFLSIFPVCISFNCTHNAEQNSVNPVAFARLSQLRFDKEKDLKIWLIWTGTPPICVCHQVCLLRLPSVQLTQRKEKSLLVSSVQVYHACYFMSRDHFQNHGQLFCTIQMNTLQNKVTWCFFRMYAAQLKLSRLKHFVTVKGCWHQHNPEI